MADIVNKIKEFEGAQSWKGQCATRLREAIEDNKNVTDIIDGFVNRTGKALTSPLPVDALAGINYRTCLKYCGYDQLSTVFNFESFTSGATNYLLPWLALTAQLPFETGDDEILPTVMSFCYAVGSPSKYFIPRDNYSDPFEFMDAKPSIVPRSLAWIWNMCQARCNDS